MDVESIVSEFEERFGGFIATVGKREKQDEDNDWLRTKLSLLAAQEKAKRDEMIKQIEGLILPTNATWGAGFDMARKAILNIINQQ